MRNMIDRTKFGSKSFAVLPVPAATAAVSASPSVSFSVVLADRAGVHGPGHPDVPSIQTIPVQPARRVGFTGTQGACRLDYIEIM